MSPAAIVSMVLIIVQSCAVGVISVETSSFFIAADDVHALGAHELVRYFYVSTSGTSINRVSELRIFRDGIYPGKNGPAHGVVLLTASALQDGLALPSFVAPDAIPGTSMAEITDLSRQLRPRTDDHLLVSISTASGKRIVVAVGTNKRAVLYACYSLIEMVLPVRFRIHGDILPDHTASPDGLYATLDDLAQQGFTPTRAPWRQGTSPSLGSVFFTPGNVSVRGLQPFHDFAEGPDPWNIGEYKLILSQMSKKKMNMIGLHTYGGSVLAEPTVWTGRPGTFNPVTGNPYKNGSYGASYHGDTSIGAVWGGYPGNITNYLFGSQNLFASDCWSSDAMRQAGKCPDALLDPPTPPPREIVPLFDGVASLLADAFTYARSLGHSTTVGIECGNVIPNSFAVNASRSLKEEYFRGTLQRINATYKADMFWVWTPEGWPARANSSIPVSAPVIQSCVGDLMSLHQARDQLYGTEAREGRPGIATCGWTVGPRADPQYFHKVLPPDVTITSINEKLGNTNIERAYGNISRGRATWSIPWLEDDPGLTGTQLWVNRTLVFARDAADLGVSGILGIHWRTRDIAPQVEALARLPWALDLTTVDVYEDIAAHEFHMDPASPVTQELVHLLSRLDSYGAIAPRQPGEAGPALPTAIPRPMVWGPGLIDCTFVYNESAWQFVDALARLRPTVSAGGVLALAQLDYFLDNFRFLRSMGMVADAWRRITGAVARGVAAVVSGDIDGLTSVWNKQLLPLRARIMSSTAHMMHNLSSSVFDTGGLGVVANLQQASLSRMIQAVDLLYGALRRPDGAARRCRPVGNGKCYVDGGPSLKPGKKGRILPYLTQVGMCSDSVTDERCAEATSMSHSLCAMVCAAVPGSSFTYAGMEGKSGSQCRCGFAINSSTAQVAPAEECALPCSGNTSEMCGGDWRIQAFEFECDDGIDDLSSVVLPPIPAANQWANHRGDVYAGRDRLFVLTPRGHVDPHRESGLDVTAVTLAGGGDHIPSTSLWWRVVAAPHVTPSGDWTEISMWREVEGRHYWKASLTLASLHGGSLIEYFVKATTHAGKQLYWPPGGAPNAHTVVVS